MVCIFGPPLTFSLVLTDSLKNAHYTPVNSTISPWGTGVQKIEEGNWTSLKGEESEQCINQCVVDQHGIDQLMVNGYCWFGYFSGFVFSIAGTMEKWGMLLLVELQRWAETYSVKIGQQHHRIANGGHYAAVIIVCNYHVFKQLHHGLLNKIFVQNQFQLISRYSFAFQFNLHGCEAIFRQKLQNCSKVPHTLVGLYCNVNEKG